MNGGGGGGCCCVRTHHHPSAVGLLHHAHPHDGVGDAAVGETLRDQGRGYDPRHVFHVPARRGGDALEHLPLETLLLRVVARAEGRHRQDGIASQRAELGRVVPQLQHDQALHRPAQGTDEVGEPRDPFTCPSPTAAIGISQGLETRLHEGLWAYDLTVEA